MQRSREQLAFQFHTRLFQPLMRKVLAVATMLTTAYKIQTMPYKIESVDTVGCIKSCGSTEVSRGQRGQLLQRPHVIP